MVSVLCFNSRARSIKTRIETWSSRFRSSSYIGIREQDPLKQGLKHCIVLSCTNETSNSRARSIKTRIETPHRSQDNPIDEPIREQDPLKQGLKLIRNSNIIISIHIREQDPLKQGLKHENWSSEQCSGRHSRARSIKTRIETKNPCGVL